MLMHHKMIPILMLTPPIQTRPVLNRNPRFAPSDKPTYFAKPFFEVL
jgi:hypothetical protein